MKQQTQLTEGETIALIARLNGMQIYEISDLIRREWKNVYFGAKPYLDAMMSLGSINDDYGADSGKSIVTYFLGNAQSFRGPVAKIVKAELNKRVKGK
jgi:hypothetical protein